VFLLRHARTDRDAGTVWLANLVLNCNGSENRQPSLRHSTRVDLEHGTPKPQADPEQTRTSGLPV